MTLEKRVAAREKAATTFKIKAKQELTALVDGIIQEIYQSPVFSQLQEKLRKD
ncbi:hypothetical protein EDC53_107193 [Phytobacter diazotrophicus]|nr:hypothetical protein EDC53_107193 [Phytobacter diazotrophicus]